MGLFTGLPEKAGVRTTEYGGIPTVVDGVTYRSRVEAKWSILLNGMFDNVCFEPFDLKGYIPDFIVQDRLLVEVKSDTSIRTLYGYTGKIERSGWAQASAILGSDPKPVKGELLSQYNHGYTIGICNLGGKFWSDLVLIGGCLISNNGSILLACDGAPIPDVHQDGTFDFGTVNMKRCDELFITAWKKAGELVRWLPSRVY